MIAGLIRQGVVLPEAVVACGTRAARTSMNSRQPTRSEPILTTVGGQGSGCSGAGGKAAALGPVLAELNGAIEPSALVLSIVAGATIDKIAVDWATLEIVRSMPNTPAQIGEGITVWTAAPEVSEEQKENARKVLGAFGDEVFVEEERFLDMATALSGTGPAYVFLFMEAMVDAGVHLGFSRRVAEVLVAKTIRGSVDFYSKPDDPLHLARLRNQVTSPGGTSAAALYYLEKAGFRTAISRAVWAAYERSRELGVDSSAHWPETLPQSRD